jgi:hypothetical protein
MADTAGSANDLTWWWAGPFAQALAAMGRAAPETLSQPILPGWMFGNVISVTEQNSSAPETERAIVAEQSYGRQLGRIMDALMVLIADRPAGDGEPQALQDLVALHAEIEAIKTKAAADRLQAVQSDLARLKSADPAEFERISGELRALLALEARPSRSGSPGSRRSRGGGAAGR